MLKKISVSFLSVSLAIAMLLLPVVAESGSALTVKALSSAPSVSAESAALLDAEDAALLLSKDADKKMPMASTTKIMTALVAIENCDITKEIEVAPDAVGVEGSSVYLFEGEVLTLSDLLYALLLASANDAAAAIAIEIGGSIEEFCELMNERARSLGLNSTNFTNPHGLYDEEHYTTARELGIITAEALKNETLRKIFSTKKITITPIDGNVRVLSNHNKMLSLYDGAIGVKTGFTKKSGRCLVSAAERDGLTLICVTLNAPDDWDDHTDLLNWGFENFRKVTFADIGEFKYHIGVVGGNCEYATLVNAEALYAKLSGDTESDVEFRVLTPYRFDYAPIEPGDTCGSVECYVDGICVASSALIYATDVKSVSENPGFFDKMKNIFSKG